MPHLKIDYSANLRERGDFDGLCAKLAQVLVAQREDGKPVFPVGGVRVRAHAAEHYCVAAGRIADAGFVHATLTIGAGRSKAAQQAACNVVFDEIKRHFARQFDSQGLALSLEFGEFSEAGTLKHNNLHAKLEQL